MKVEDKSEQSQLGFNTVREGLNYVIGKRVELILKGYGRAIFRGGF